MDNSKIKNLNRGIKGRKFQLKKWSPPKDNPNWSHDHCEICHVEISNLENAEKEAYVDKKEFYWICKSCFRKLKSNQ